MNIYHRDFGFPAHIEQAVRRIRLPGVVAGVAHYNDRAAEKGLPTVVTAPWLQSARLVEAQTEDGSIKRVLIRGAYDTDRDLCLVLDIPRSVIITGWLNHRDDWHRLTSERSKEYMTA